MKNRILFHGAFAIFIFAFTANRSYLTCLPCDVLMLFREVGTPGFQLKCI
jgi:hypothetical protein